MTDRWRPVARLVPAEPASDGAGVRLNRSIATANMPALDPFLLLDEFNSEDKNDYIAGFPEHPHRGFETVTYMIEGRMRHEDNAGNAGLLRSGGVQWMTAGRGILHSEMPEQEDGRMQGFQLWVNLPARLKMTDPRYQDIEPEDVPVVARDDGATVRVVAGEHGGASGPVEDVFVKPLYLVVTLPPGAAIDQAVPDGHTGFVYVFGGEGVTVTEGDPAGNGETGTQGGFPVRYRNLAVLGAGDKVGLRNDTKDEVRLLLIAGAPIGEPIARYGPFVMNTEQEIYQAFKDFQEGNF
jgi:redox-sensitive bicupin YhaK (pirin superfamily)